MQIKLKYKAIEWSSLNYDPVKYFDLCFICNQFFNNDHIFIKFGGNWLHNIIF